MITVTNLPVTMCTYLTNNRLRGVVVDQRATASLRTRNICIANEDPSSRPGSIPELTSLKSQDRISTGYVGSGLIYNLAETHGALKLYYLRYLINVRDVDSISKAVG